MYTFADQDGEFHVYKHHDGYPEGGASAIRRAVKAAWELPRFEADEFGCAFIASNKDSPGGLRLMPSGKWQDVAPGDLEYRYRVSVASGKGQFPSLEAGRTLRVECWSISERDGKWTEKPVFAGTLTEFLKKYHKFADQDSAAVPA